MTPLRTAIFVDGANFRANLRNFWFSSPSPSDRGYRLEERHFDWKLFYDGVIQKFNEATGWKHLLNAIDARLSDLTNSSAHQPQ